MKTVLAATTLVSLGLAASAANLTLVQEYSGTSFFDKWNFYGDSTAGLLGTWNGSHPYDDRTNGDVFYMGRSNGSSLYSVDSSTGHAFIKVDNTTSVPYLQKRDSIRISTQDFFNLGTVWVIDAYHLPWGCSVWPSIWTSGQKWPQQGEIDIIEGVNRMTFNQMALHTLPGCSAAANSGQTGTTSGTDCSPAAGCAVAEQQPNSYGLDFANNGGGVWATQFDTTGIYIWFWTRSQVPASITTAIDSIDISSWGAPSAAYPSSTCDISQFFGPQQLIIDITLCGDWAGVDSIYAATCNDTPQLPANAAANSRCYVDNVINNGTADYSMAYFELGAIRAFSSNSTPTVSGSASGSAGPTSAGSSGATTTASGAGAGTTGGANTSGSGSGSSNAAMLLTPAFVTPVAVVMALFSWMLL